MTTLTVQEARTLKLFGYFSSPHSRCGVEFLPLDSDAYNNARHECSVLDVHLIALQTKLFQAIDNVTGRTALQKFIIGFITPDVKQPKPYMALHQRWVGRLQATGIPGSDESSFLIRRTDLRILQAIAKFTKSEQPNETLRLSTAQDLSNSVRFTADRLLVNRSTDEIVLAHFVLDKLIAQAVWGGGLKDFRLNNYQAVKS